MDSSTSVCVKCVDTRACLQKLYDIVYYVITPPVHISNDTDIELEKSQQISSYPLLYTMHFWGQFKRKVKR